MVSEVYKCQLKDIVPYLEILFNMILSAGEFPTSWSKSILTPIYKNGDRQNPQNCRGISLIDVMRKVFTKILNCRIVHWAEINNRFSEAQCGYRQGRSTKYHVFSLMGIIQKYTSKKKGHLHCLYIDFSAAYDSVRHDMQWYVLMKLGLHGNVLKVLQPKYQKFNSSIFVSDGITEHFAYDKGTRQGCMVSTSLFLISK